MYVAFEDKGLRFVSYLVYFRLIPVLTLSEPLNFELVYSKKYYTMYSVSAPSFEVENGTMKPPLVTWLASNISVDKFCAYATNIMKY